MTPFQIMLYKTTSSVYHNKMMRFASPLKDHFGINHFWYYRVTYSGQYSFVGTHSLWNEFCFAHDVFGKFPYLRHPDSLTSGISLMKNIHEEPYKSLLDTASSQFDINLHIHLLKKIPEGVEGYGFGTMQKLNLGDEFILNELPLLTQYIKQFRIENEGIFKTIYEYQVDLASHLGSEFTRARNVVEPPKNRDGLLQILGYHDILRLSRQERKVFRALASGFSAPYIAKKLFLSSRTVEYYISIIKRKLSIESRVELLNRAKAFTAVESPSIDF